MSEFTISEPELKITGDKVPYNLAIFIAIQKWFNAVIITENSFSQLQIEQAAKAMKTLAMKEYLDEEFKDDLKAAVIEEDVDTRPIWCGVRIGNEKPVKTKRDDPYKIVEACLNLFNRRGYMSKKKITQIFTGETFTEEEADDLRKQSV